MAHALDSDALLAEARAGTHLSDFGDPSFREPMQRLCQALREEARLNEVASPRNGNASSTSWSRG